MQQKLINGRWMLSVPNSIADWDAPTGDPSLGTGWEAKRLQSMQENLRWGDVVFDIGTEHAWLAAVIAREFVGPQNMVLMEPSPEFWPNIRLTWKHNGFKDPLACWAGFVGAETSAGWRPEDTTVPGPLWPAGSDGPETGAMAYRSLTTNNAGIPTISVDDMILHLGVSPRALNIDVEGAELLVLQGAKNWLDNTLGTQVWVSIHPDLMENFGHTKDELLGFMSERGFNVGRHPYSWKSEHINTDHEEHWRFWVDDVE